MLVHVYVKRKKKQRKFRMFNVVHLAFVELEEFSHKENITVRGINYQTFLKVSASCRDAYDGREMIFTHFSVGS